MDFLEMMNFFFFQAVIPDVRWGAGGALIANIGTRLFFLFLWFFFSLRWQVRVGRGLVLGDVDGAFSILV